MEGGRVNHSWCTRVVMAMVDRVGVGMHAGQSQGGSHVWRCRSTSRVRFDDARSHRHPGAQLWVGSTGIGRSSWEAFARDATTS